MYYRFYLFSNENFIYIYNYEKKKMKKKTSDIETSTPLKQHGIYQHLLLNLLHQPPSEQQ
jgi:hypothetical protein